MRRYGSRIDRLGYVRRLGTCSAGVDDAFFLIGMIVTTVIGLPLLYLVDRWFHFTGRYIVGGALYGDIF